MNASTAHPIMHSTMAAPFRCQGRARPRVSASAATAAMTSHSGTIPPQAQARGELVHQPGEHDHPGLVGALRVAGVRGVVAEAGDPEPLGQDRGRLPDAQDAGRVGQQVVGDVAVGQLAGVPGVQRAQPDRRRVPVVVARVPGPADGKAQRAELGGCRGPPGHDVREDHVHGLDVVQPLAVGAGVVPHRVGAGQHGQRRGDHGRRGALPVPEPAQPAPGAVIGAGQDQGDAHRRGQDQVLLLGQEGQETAGTGQDQAVHWSAASPARDTRHRPRPASARPGRRVH